MCTKSNNWKHNFSTIFLTTSEEKVKPRPHQQQCRNNRQQSCQVLRHCCWCGPGLRRKLAYDAALRRHAADKLRRCRRRKLLGAPLPPIAERRRATADEKWHGADLYLHGHSLRPIASLFRWTFCTVVQQLTRFFTIIERRAISLRLLSLLFLLWMQSLDSKVNIKLGKPLMAQCEKMQEIKAPCQFQCGTVEACAPPSVICCTLFVCRVHCGKMVDVTSQWRMQDLTEGDARRDWSLNRAGLASKKKTFWHYLHSFII